MKKFTKEHLDVLNAIGIEAIEFIIDKIKSSILKDKQIESVTLIIIHMMKTSIISNIHCLDMTVSQSLTTHFELLSAMLEMEGVCINKITVKKNKN